MREKENTIFRPREKLCSWENFNRNSMKIQTKKEKIMRKTLCSSKTY